MIFVRYQFNKLFLLSGEDLTLSGSFTVRHPKMRDVVCLGDGAHCEDLYWLYVITMMSEPYDNMVWLDDHGIDYQDVSPYTVFCLKWIDVKEKRLIATTEDRGSAAFAEQVIVDTLSFFLGTRAYNLRVVPNGFEIYDQSDPSWAFSEDKFELVHDFVCAVNRLDNVKRINPATPMAKKMLIEDTRSEQKKRRKRKRKSDDTEYLGESAAALLFSGATSSMGAIMEFGVYAMLNGGEAVNNSMRVEALLTGVYTNKIKADSVSSDDLRWSK